MKYIKIVGVLFVSLILMVSCEDTNENLVGSRGIAVIPTISDLTPASPSLSSFSEDTITFTVSLPEGETVDAAEIEVVYEGMSATVKEISSFPAEIVIIGTDLLDALNITSDDVELGTSMFLYVLTTSSGLTTRSSAYVEAQLPCEFDAALTVGSYYEESEDWYVSGDVTCTAAEGDPYTIYISGIAANEGLASYYNNDLEIHIDPDNYKITGGSILIADDLSEWGSNYASYTNYTLGVVDGKYSSCDGTYTINIEATVDQGSFGTYEFVFTQN